MKKFIPFGTFGILLLIVSTNHVSAQTFSEWFRQNKSRIKRLQQQVVALELLKTTIEKGYSIAGKGVDSVGSLSREEWKLNRDYIESLHFVKPVLLARLKSVTP